MKAEINEIKIERSRYGERKGQYVAKIELGSDRAIMRFDVSPEFAEKVLQLCAAEIIGEVNRAATDLSIDIALSAGLEIDESAYAAETGAFRLLASGEEP